MKKLLSIITLIALVVSCCPDELASNPSKGSIFKAEFNASPAVFSAEGGVGIISGILQELSSGGKILNKAPLAKEDYTVSLKNGDASQITLNPDNKEFVVSKGGSATFELEVTVTKGKAKGGVQILTIHRKGTLSYTFEASPHTFAHDGGEGQVTGICKVIGSSGTVITEEPLAKDQFTLILKQGETSELTSDETEKTFTVKAGKDEATFVLEAKALATGATPQEITIHREAKPSPTILLPLDYVAEYNIDAEGSNFVQTQACDVSGYFTFDEAVTKFTEITMEDVKYHLPTQKEWLSIVPLDKTPIDYINFTQTYTHKDISESVSVAGQDVSSKNDYYAPGNGIVYALRYKGTDFVSAWRYEILTNNEERTMRITVRSLKDETTQISIEDIGKDSFWTGENEVVRLFPASGIKTSSGSVALRGSDGYFWAVTDKGGLNGWGMFFDGSSSDVGGYMRKLQCSVRLFMGEK